MPRPTRHAFFRRSTICSSPFAVNVRYEIQISDNNAPAIIISEGHDSVVPCPCVSSCAVCAHKVCVVSTRQRV